jgi:hypothetical protein
MADMICHKVYEFLMSILNIVIVSFKCLSTSIEILWYNCGNRFISDFLASL